MRIVGPEDAPLVLILHGWGSSAALMTGFSTALSDRFRVALVDLPGHGEASPPSRPWTMDDHACAVADLIGNRPAHLVGHSNGGRLALFMASRPEYAERIGSLVLISPSGVERPRSLSFHLKRLTASALKAPFRLFPEPLRRLGLDWLRHSLVWRMLGSSDYRSLTGTMRETFVNLVNTYVTDALGRITVPVLLFWGTKDDAIVRAQIDVLLSSIPDIGLVELEGAGHYGFLEAPGIVHAGTRRFLDDLEVTA